MLVVLSPAKRLDWSPAPIGQTQPAFMPDAAELADLARGLGAAELARLMGLSDRLARLNHDRFAAFRPDPDPQATRPAAFAFAGDTYAGLEARTLPEDALRWADDRLRILSGLYGLLRPRDAIQPHRLEMGTRLATPRGRDLYRWWGTRLAEALTAEADRLGTRWLLNCASQEYFAAVDRAALGPEVITPVFLEDRSGGPRIVSFFTKKARGAMARFVMEHRLQAPADILGFDSGGYRHAPDLSEPGRPAFLRPG